MSQQAYVQQIEAKNTSVGTMYDFHLSDGNKVGAGKFPPKGVNEGDYIAYDYVAKGNYKNFTPGSIKKLAAPAGVAAPSGNASASPAGGNRNFNDERQTTISKQAALNSALTMVGLLVAADALPVAKSAKTDKKSDLLVAIVDKYTARFYKQATGAEMEFADTETLAAAGIDAAEAGDGNWEEA